MATFDTTSTRTVLGISRTRTVTHTVPEPTPYFPISEFASLASRPSTPAPRDPWSSDRDRVVRNNIA